MKKISLLAVFALLLTCRMDSFAASTAMGSRRWAVPLRNFAAWRLTAKGSEAMGKMSFGRHWAALNVLSSKPATQTAQLQPLYDALDDVFSGSDADRLENIMMNLQTMSNVHPSDPQSESNLMMMISNLEAARLIAAPAAEIGAIQLMRRRVIRDDEPYANRTQMKRRIQEVNGAANMLLGMSLYGEDVASMAQLAVDKATHLQSAWVAKWGDEALNLGELVVETDGAVWAGRTVIGNKVSVRLGKPRKR